MAQGRLGQPGRLGMYTYKLKEGRQDPRGPGRARRGVVAWGAQGQSAAALGNRTCPTRPTTQLASSGPTRTARRTTRRFSQWHDALTARRMRPCSCRPAWTSSRRRRSWRSSSFGTATSFLLRRGIAACRARRACTASCSTCIPRQRRPQPRPRCERLVARMARSASS